MKKRFRPLAASHDECHGIGKLVDPLSLSVKHGFGVDEIATTTLRHQHSIRASNRGDLTQISGKPVGRKVCQRPSRGPHGVKSVGLRDLLMADHAGVTSHVGGRFSLRIERVDVRACPRSLGICLFPIRNLPPKTRTPDRNHQKKEWDQQKQNTGGIGSGFRRHAAPLRFKQKPNDWLPKSKFLSHCLRSHPTS